MGERECVACKEGVPRKQIWGTDPPSFVHHYGGNPGTVAPCTAPQEQADEARSKRLLREAEVIQLLEPEGFEPMGSGTMSAIQRLAKHEPEKRWAADTVEWLAATALHYFALVELGGSRELP